MTTSDLIIVAAESPVITREEAVICYPGDSPWSGQIKPDTSGANIFCFAIKKLCTKRG